jgi:hypothetical protein
MYSIRKVWFSSFFSISCSSLLVFIDSFPWQSFFRLLLISSFKSSQDLYCIIRFSLSKSFPAMYELFKARKKERHLIEFTLVYEKGTIWKIFNCRCHWNVLCLLKSNLCLVESFLISLLFLSWANKKCSRHVLFANYSFYLFFMIEKVKTFLKVCNCFFCQKKSPDVLIPWSVLSLKTNFVFVTSFCFR